MSKPSDRVARALDLPDLVERLAALPGSAWSSLLLRIEARRAAARSPAQVLAQHRRDAFVQPAAVDPRILSRIDARIFEILPPSFEPIALSPVVPLGTVSAVALASQDKVCSAIRSLEVVSDPTNALALIAAARRRAGRGIVRLCTSHRTLRLQRFDGPGSWQHFQMFAWITAGRDPGGRRFEASTLQEHLALHRSVLDRLRAEGLPLEVIRLRIATDPAHRGWLDPVLDALAPDAVRSDLPPDGYYRWLRFGLDVQLDGAWSNLSDGGFVGWGEALCHSRKERLFISALGTERLAMLWARAL